jgi:ribonucleoside-diphosphate reductase beta chain
MSKRKDIFGTRKSFKPFSYPEFYQLWLDHERIHWIGKEVPLHEDLREWNNKLTTDEKEFLSFVFRLFVQGDLDVAEGYVKNYMPHFNHPEIRMMLMGFAAREATHIDAYSHLIETLGMTDEFYDEFMKYPIMKEKHEYFEQLISNNKNKENLPLSIAGISAFTEGMFLFSSFVMLLNFPRQGKMKGMSQIVTWSIIDESIHVEGLTKIFRHMIKENKEWWTDETKKAIYDTAEKMTELEDQFIDLCYENHDVMNDLDKNDLKQYIRYIVDRRLIGLGMKGIYKVKKSPLPWVEEMINSQNHENFFEARATSYAKGALEGSWSDVWGKYQ